MFVHHQGGAAGEPPQPLPHRTGEGGHHRGQHRPLRGGQPRQQGLKGELPGRPVQSAVPGQAAGKHHLPPLQGGQGHGGVADVSRQKHQAGWTAGAFSSFRARTRGTHTAGVTTAATMASGTPFTATMPRMKASTSVAGMPWAAA